MAVLILRPNSDVEIEQSRTSGTTNYSCIDEVTLSTSDYCYVSENSFVDIYSFPNHTTEIGVINSVTVKAYSAGDLYGSINLCVAKFQNGEYVKHYSGFQEIVQWPPNLYLYSWTTNPITFAEWTWQEIDDLLAGDMLIAPDTSTTMCYQLWVEVDYADGSSIAKDNNWNQIKHVDIADGGQIKIAKEGYIVVNGEWKKWWPPPSSRGGGYSAP